MAFKAVLLISLFVIFVFSEENNNLMETKYLEVPIDHFGVRDNNPKKFNLRYLITRKFHVNEGPVFLYVGHQEDVTVYPRNIGFLFNIAPTFNALMVFVEHRYYGTSLPFGNETFKSPKNLRYLSSTQVLADLANVISHVRTKYFKNREPNSIPVIVFGGGYGGNLAAWLRMKYPFMAKGAIASSAPMIYSTDPTNCEKFYEKITEIFQEFGQETCIKTIKLSWDVINNLSKSQLGLNFMSSSFKMCSPMRSAEDIDTLLNWLSNMYIDLASFNYQYPTHYNTELPAYPVKVFCEKLTTSNFNDTKGFIEHFGKAIGVYTNYSGQAVCNDINSSINNPTEIARNYQTCTELINSKCSTESDMFITQPWKMEKFSRDCYFKFEIKNESIDAPQMTYGGFNVESYSNIVFTNNMYDPWSVYGIYNNASSSATIYNILKGTHHIDLRGQDTSDNNYVIKARNYHINAIKQWLNIN